jgi:4-amino-4-deoxy-L-arabinose transferase-like glycosyltransferase
MKSDHSGDKSCARESRWARRERPIVALLGLLAVTRVLLFAASFPFFANTDEGAHFDAVVKYSHGHLPREDNSQYDRESARFIVLYSSPEFYHAVPSHPPIWLAPRNVRQEALRNGLPFWQRAGNHESFQPPLYYVIAGGWYRVGRSIGIEGVALLYWVRAINALFFGLLFWVAYLYCRDFIPDRAELRISILLLLSVFPQDVFFAISNDVVSPLAYLLALYLMLGLFSAERGWGHHLGAGLAVAAAFLVKMTNVAILFVALLLFLLRARQLYASGQWREQGPRLCLLAIALVVPVMLWLGWNAHAVGDVTGHARIAAGWTPKPFSQLLDHPIFTWKGASYFVRELVTSYWRGELFWHGDRLASPLADVFYLASTLVFGGVGLFVAAREGLSGGGVADVRRLSNLVCALSVLIGIAFLVWVSIGFDFGKWWYPSRKLPYLTAGRLISGSLVPFLILYCSGLDRLLGRVFRRPPTLAVASGIALGVMGSELAISWSVFGSAFNWLHL